jgi:thioredoxin-like negative regulator of GroEL
MHTMALAAVLIVLAGDAPAGDTEAPRSIPWKAALGEARAASIEAKKPLLIDFGAEWCGFCKKLDRETFADERVIRAVTEGFLAVKVDTDREPEAAKAHRVQALPTVVVLSPAGKEVHRVEGFRPPDLFLEDLKKASGAGKELERLETEARKEPGNAAAQRAWARAVAASGDAAEAVRILNDAAGAAKAGSADLAGIALDLGDLHARGGRHAEARSAYEKALGAGSAEAALDRRKAGLALARVLIALRDAGAAVRVLDELLDRSGASGRERLEGLFLRAYAHAVLRDDAKAAADLRAAAAEDPEGRWGARASYILELVESK